MLIENVIKILPCFPNYEAYSESKYRFAVKKYSIKVS